jgi:hypothetical protein
MRAEVGHAKGRAAFNADVTRNEGLIRSRMADGYQSWFALYPGGDASAMVEHLVSHGYNAKVDGGVWCKL